MWWSIEVINAMLLSNVDEILFDPRMQRRH